LAVLKAILGAFRGRCIWYTPLKYLGGALVYAALFYASLWINSRLSIHDKLSVTLFLRAGVRPVGPAAFSLS
jgi:hypothetical protein